MMQVGRYHMCGIKPDMILPRHMFRLYDRTYGESHLRMENGEWRIAVLHSSCPSVYYFVVVIYVQVNAFGYALPQSTNTCKFHPFSTH